MARRLRGFLILSIAVAVLLHVSDLRFVAVPSGSPLTGRVGRNLGGRSASGSTPVVARRAQEYSLIPLPYAYDALEPYLDQATMEFHHDKHHLTYVTNLNKALEGKPHPPLLELVRTAIQDGPVFRNSGGGVYNHNLLWLEMAPYGTGGAPSPRLLSAIAESFGSMDKFQADFEAAGAPGARFGSGWVWLVVDKDKKLAITSTPNQDNPLMEGVDCIPGIPILTCDVWEHAYYLKYQYRRADYIKASWGAVNWEQVSNWYEDALLGNAPVVDA